MLLFLCMMPVLHELQRGTFDPCILDASS